MDKEIKERIAVINSGIIPEGYKKTKVGIVPVEWEIVKLANIMHNESRPVDKPNEPYIRIGIRSHAKGTLQELVENPAEVNMDTLYVVKKDDIVVNITFAWEHAIALASEEDDGKLVSHRFPTYVFDNNSPLYYKYVFCQDMFRQRLELISPGGAGRNRVLNKTDFINLEIYHPPLHEQQKIAEILSTQDKLIELQEKKIEKLKELKKAYLQKMFPKKGSKYPELRFKGFTDAWEQRKFSDLAQRESAVEVSSPDCPSVEYEDVIVEEGRLNKDIRLKETQKTGIKFDGTQVLYGKLRPYLHNWLNPDFTGVAVGDWWVLRPICIDKDYLYRLIQTKQFDDVANQSAGSKMPRADWNLISNTEFFVPISMEEQGKIAQAFTNLDTLITLHQRKSEQEKQKKKALMQLLLTGIVRTK